MLTGGTLFFKQRISFITGMLRKALQPYASYQ
jgi:hypothetical protein